MTVRTRADYEHMLSAVGVCTSARVPILIWGNPGEGKTAVIESAAQRGWHVESLIISHYEPSDFAGLPVVTPDGAVNLAPPGWARRLADHDGPSIAFFDEFSTASPSLQAAALRPLTHFEVGSLKLPETVSFVAAANPSDVAAAGWELAAPTSNRFVHLDWEMPLEVYAECMVTDQWPTLPVHDTPLDLGTQVRAIKVMVSGFLNARQTQLSSIPKSAADRGRAFPTPRTWDYAARLLAFAQTVEAHKATQRLLVAGCVGDAIAHEFLTWLGNQDLPDADELLAGNDFDFTKVRPDRVYVILQSVLAAVIRETTAERWTRAVEICSRAAAAVGIDPAVPAVRALVRGGLRPPTATLPPDIKVFGAALSLAGLLK
ncbi:ATP-binding protein [Nocardioides kribbensis]|uniref:ATP-binding protein n=1 Tax=Nocardioides kribbensis TaxID=305517 RepID=A0ABV1NTD6_9ACTN